MSMHKPMPQGLEFDNVLIKRNGEVLVSLSARVEPGKLLAVTGPSGSGKSTLLSYIAGFLPAAFVGTGPIFLDGKDITNLPTNQRKLGLMFQDPLLFPHLSVAENLLLAIPAETKGKAHRNRLVSKALKDAELDIDSDRDPATLSGGQQSRVALMRVLLSNPHALLLDEPFSRLDRDMRQNIRSFVFSMAKQRNLPVVLVTHDHEDIPSSNTQILKL